MDGIINVYKEAGFTSHDVVAKLRGICRQKKIGHTGTLDPQATGVLPVCLGSATRACEMLTDRTKEYVAELLLGQTDTQDTTGTVLEEREVAVDEAQVREVIGSFVGGYDQIPPMYSALKVNGKKLCDLARAGKEVERKARRVQILDISVEKIELPRVWMTVSCSKGTYIRTLCYDIGRKLGCGGCMESLLRTRVDRFRLEDSLTLSQIEKLLRTRVDRFQVKDSLKLDEIEVLRDEGKVGEYICSLEEALEGYLPVYTTAEGDKALKNGNPCFKQQLDLEKSTSLENRQSGDRYRMYNSQGIFMGVYEYQEEKHWWKPWKMFMPDGEGN